MTSALSQAGFAPHATTQHAVRGTSLAWHPGEVGSHPLSSSLAHYSLPEHFLARSGPAARHVLKRPTTCPVGAAVEQEGYG